jgi:hypothetical protein
VTVRSPADAGHYALIVLTVLCLSASTAVAQSATPPLSDHKIEFLSRAQLRLSAEHLSSDDKRFVWDTNFGGEIDFVDYGVGRATFVANYQAILGEEFRDFDPNSGNYTLEGSSSVRLGRLEVAAVFHHLSRHLSDRPKRDAIDWNMVGGRLQTSATMGITQTEARIDVRRVILHTYVDYTWELNAAVQNVHQFHTRVAAISGASLQVLGTDGTRARGTQTGVRGEGGVRFIGRAGSVELFVAGERRVDPYPLDFGVDNWLTAGFRLLSR